MEIEQGSLQTAKVDKHINIRRLPSPFRGFLIQILAVALVACLIIVLFGLGLYPFEKTFLLPENESPIHAPLSFPISLLFFLFIGMGLVLGPLFFVSYHPDWKAALLTRIIIILLALSPPLAFLKLLVLDFSQVFTGWFSILVLILAVGYGLAATFLAFKSTPHHAKRGSILLTASFILTSFGMLLIQGWWKSLAAQNAQLLLNYATSMVLMAITFYVLPFIWMAGVVFFWQAIAEVKIFSREFALRLANHSESHPRWLWILFAFKVLLVAGSLIGFLSGIFPEPWQGTFEDGPLAWLLAATFAILAGWWLMKKNRPTFLPDFNRSSGFLTFGFLLFFILAFVLFIPAALLFNVGLQPPGFFLANLSFSLAKFGIQWTLIFSFLQLALGLAFRFIPKWRGLSPILLAAGIWVLPSALQFPFPKANLSFEYLTFDLLLTLVLFAIAVLSKRNRIQTVDPWILTLVLSVSTLVALAESLVPQGLTGIVFAILLVVPMLYQIFFDSSTLNKLGEQESHKIIRVFGLQTVLMLVVTVALVLQLISAQTSSFEDVANKLFLPPILGFYVAGLIGKHKNLNADTPEILPSTNLEEVSAQPG